MTQPRHSGPVLPFAEVSRLAHGDEIVVTWGSRPGNDPEPCRILVDKHHKRRAAVGRRQWLLAPQDTVTRGWDSATRAVYEARYAALEGKQAMRLFIESLEQRSAASEAAPPVWYTTKAVADEWVLVPRQLLRRARADFDAGNLGIDGAALLLAEVIADARLLGVLPGVEHLGARDSHSEAEHCCNSAPTHRRRRTYDEAGY